MLNSVLQEVSFTRVSDLKRLAFIINSLTDLIGKNGSVLDIGCGNGIISNSLAAAGYEVTGIDVSEKAIAKAKASYQLPNLQFKVKNAADLQVQKKRYDAIICSEVLEHLTNPLQLLHTINALVSDKGVIIVTVPNGLGPRELLMTRPTLFIRDHMPLLWTSVLKIKTILGYSGATIQSEADELDHIQFFNIADLRSMAAKSSFEILKLESTNFIDDVFPFSLLYRKSIFLQKIDAKVADLLPYYFTGGFVSVWKKI